MTELTNRMSTPYNRTHHRFAVVAACFVFLLIVAGALVTSNEAGLSVPDWPTSFGSLYRIPPLVGGVKFEHGHRMLAELIGLLTIALAVWTQRVDQRRWMRVLAWSALGTVIAQGILGGLTVLFYLPPAISTAHATLAQTFFCIMVSIAFFTSKSWVQDACARRSPGRPTASYDTRHADRGGRVAATDHGCGLPPLRHSFAAAHHRGRVVFCMVNWLADYHPQAPSRDTATGAACDVLLALLMVQVTLGLASYITRVLWSQGVSAPLASMVAATVAHVACGALVLVTISDLTVQIHRHVDVNFAPDVVRTSHAHLLRKARCAHDRCLHSTCSGKLGHPRTD